MEGALHPRIDEPVRSVFALLQPAPTGTFSGELMVPGYSFVQPLNSPCNLTKVVCHLRFRTWYMADFEPTTLTLHNSGGTRFFGHVFSGFSFYQNLILNN